LVTQLEPEKKARGGRQKGEKRQKTVRNARHSDKKKNLRDQKGELQREKTRMLKNHAIKGKRKGFWKGGPQKRSHQRKGPSKAIQRYLLTAAPSPLVRTGRVQSNRILNSREPGEKTTPKPPETQTQGGRGEREEGKWYSKGPGGGEEKGRKVR